MNKEPAIIVQARMSSSRFPGKSLALIGDKPLIYYVVKRLELVGIPVIVATSCETSDDPLAKYLESQGIKIFRGSLNNVLDRYIGAAEELNVDKIVRITADNPLVDIVALKKTLLLFQRYDYVDGIYSNGFIKGTGFELVNLAELKSIKTQELYYLEHVTTLLRERTPQNPNYLKLPAPYYHQNINKIILTCDYKEDLKLLKIIFKIYNYRFSITIPEIIDLYVNNPEMFLINNSLHN